ncbi:hypothetical protein N9C83_02080 [Opitutales bacterium]|nr:hypothetical protein [Opitutales bacterium]
MHIHCDAAAPRDPLPAVVGWYTPAVQVICLGWNVTFTEQVLVEFYWSIYPEDATD